MTEEEIKRRLRGWIVEHCGGIRPEDLGDDTPIIEQRIVSSLHALELLCHIERLRQRPLDNAELKPFMLHSIDAIYEAFFRES